MSTLGKLRRKDPSTGHEIEPLRRHPLLLERKMSEVLLDFAEPILDGMRDDSCFDDAIAFSALCWNLALMPSEEQRVHLNDAAGAMAGSDLFKREGIQQCVRMLLDRKRAFFADCKRLIVDYEIVQERTGPRLLVVSAPFKDLHAPEDMAHPGNG